MQGEPRKCPECGKVNSATAVDCRECCTPLVNLNRRPLVNPSAVDVSSTPSDMPLPSQPTPPNVQPRYLAPTVVPLPMPQNPAPQKRGLSWFSRK